MPGGSRRLLLAGEYVLSPHKLPDFVIPDLAEFKVRLMKLISMRSMAERPNPSEENQLTLETPPCRSSSRTSATALLATQQIPPSRATDVYSICAEKRLLGYESCAHEGSSSPRAGECRVRAAALCFRGRRAPGCPQGMGRSSVSPHAFCEAPFS